VVGYSKMGITPHRVYISREGESRTAADPQGKVVCSTLLKGVRAT
jgi:hypothetical protein